MPRQNRRDATVRNGQHNKADILKVMRAEIPRDNLSQAFEGKENKGPAKRQKTTSKSSTGLRSRKTQKSQSSDRTPVR